MPGAAEPVEREEGPVVGAAARRAACAEVAVRAPAGRPLPPRRPRSSAGVPTASRVVHVRPARSRRPRSSCERCSEDPSRDVELHSPSSSCSILSALEPVGGVDPHVARRARRDAKGWWPVVAAVGVVAAFLLTREAHIRRPTSLRAAGRRPPPVATTRPSAVRDSFSIVDDATRCPATSCWSIPEVGRYGSRRRRMKGSARSTSRRRRRSTCRSEVACRSPSGGRARQVDRARPGIDCRSSGRGLGGRIEPPGGRRRRKVRGCLGRPRRDRRPGLHVIARCESAASEGA